MPETRRQKKRKKKEEINKKLGLVEICCYFFHILDLKSDLNIKIANGFGKSAVACA